MPPLRSVGLADLAEAPDAPIAERRTLRDAARRGDAAHPRVKLAKARALAREDRLTGEAGRVLRDRHTFSVSELEAYLNCPYRWFYERRLSGEPLDREVDALERGKLAHEAMRCFYEAWSEEGYERVTPETLPQAREVAARASFA